jgi:hypothetical protein
MDFDGIARRVALHYQQCRVSTDLGKVIWGNVGIQEGVRVSYRQPYRHSRMTLELRVSVYPDATQKLTPTASTTVVSTLTGATDEAIGRGVRRLLNKVDYEVQRQEAVKRLAALCKPFLADTPRFLEAVEEKEKEWGVSEYVGMSLSDAERWCRWAEAWAHVYYAG